MFDLPQKPQEKKPVSSLDKRYLNAGPQLTPRWEYALRFVGQQGAVRFDQLQKLLGRLSPQPQDMKQPGILTAERTRKLLRRWTDEDLYCYRVFYARQRGWIWLTRKGLKFADLDLRYYEPAPSSLAHLFALNEIRLMIEARRPADLWISERQLRVFRDAAIQAGNVSHLPDAELCNAQGQVNGIECELTVKSEKRLEEILFDLAANKRYSTIWYFAPEHVYATLTKMLHKLPREHQTRFVIYTLEGKPYAV